MLRKEREKKEPKKRERKELNNSNAN